MGTRSDPPAASNDKLGPDTSAADVDGAESPAGPQGHHESVGERQGRQPAQERPAATDLRCAKCGSEDILTRWHQGHGRYGSGGCGFSAKVVVYVEHLHRTCRACQFEWADDTLDSNDMQEADAMSAASVPDEAMVEFYVEPWREPDGRTTYCVLRLTYAPDHYGRHVVSWHETRREAQEERDRLAAA